jgi:hypothetical protein
VPATVTVVDPRHPLYDQTFPLIHIKNKQELVRSCLVLLRENVERLIPLAVTDLALSPPDVFPVPLDISSLQNLIETFSRMTSQLEQEDENGADRSCTAGGAECCSPTGMDHLDRSGAERSAADCGPHLPRCDSKLGEGGEE